MWLRLFQENTSLKVNAHGDQYYNLSGQKSLFKKIKSYDILEPQLRMY